MLYNIKYSNRAIKSAVFASGITRITRRMQRLVSTKVIVRLHLQYVLSRLRRKLTVTK